MTLTYLAVRARHNQDIHTVHLALLKRRRLVFALQARRGVQQNPLLAIRHVLLVLTRQHALHTGTPIFLGDLFHDIGDVPVLISGLDGAHGDLCGVVRGTHDIGRDALCLVPEDDRLGVNDGVAIEVDTEHDFHHVAGFELDFGVGREGGKVGDDVVDRDTGGEGDTYYSVPHLVTWGMWHTLGDLDTVLGLVPQRSDRISD